MSHTLGEAQKKLDDFVAGLPTLVVTCKEFKALSEYSTTLPTGATPGKRWKRHCNSFGHEFIRAGGKPRWIIGEYDPAHDGKGKTIDINWYRPVVRVKATQVICQDKYEQSDFLFSQVYWMSGLNPFDHSTSEARAECQRRGFNIPTTRSLYESA